jgi:hypothetical protein
MIASFVWSLRKSISLTRQAVEQRRSDRDDFAVADDRARSLVGDVAAFGEPPTRAIGGVCEMQRRIIAHVLDHRFDFALAAIKLVGLAS